MLAEGQGRVGGAGSEVGGEPHLLTQRPAGSDLAGLAVFGVADGLGQVEQLLDAVGRDEDRSVLVREYDVLAGDRPAADRCRGQRVGRLRVETERPRRQGAEAEDGKADRGDVNRVAVQPADHDPRDSGGLGLEGDQVADARLVPSAAVVHDQYVARLGGLERLQEHVDTAHMLRRQHPPGDPPRGRSRQRHRAYRQPRPKARIRHMRRGQPREPLHHPETSLERLRTTGGSPPRPANSGVNIHPSATLSRLLLSKSSLTTRTRGSRRVLGRWWCRR